MYFLQFSKTLDSESDPDPDSLTMLDPDSVNPIHNTGRGEVGIFWEKTAPVNITSWLSFAGPAADSVRRVGLRRGGAAEPRGRSGGRLGARRRQNCGGALGRGPGGGRGEHGAPPRLTVGRRPLHRAQREMAAWPPGHTAAPCRLAAGGR